jgi:membrane protease subunit HflC
VSRTLIFAVALAIVLGIGLSMVFVVDEREQALVLAFGRVDRVESEPGIKFKLPPPFNTVEYYEDRILPLETSELEVTPADDRRLVVDAFARWRIVDPKQYRQSVQSQTAAVSRLRLILNAALREVLGGESSGSVLSGERATLIRQIRDSTREQSSALGVEIIDVRIRRADLPEQNLQATFQRMEAERQREAADERARGAEAAQKVRAGADRAAVELVSEARRSSEIIRGEADAQRNYIFADAFGRDPEFFAFYRSLTAYVRSLKGSNSTLVLTPNSEFFEYLKSDGMDPAPR